MKKKVKIIPETVAFESVCNSTRAFRQIFDAFKSQMIGGKFYHNNRSVYNQLGFYTEHDIRVTTFDINKKLYNLGGNSHRIMVRDFILQLVDNGFKDLDPTNVTFRMYKRDADQAVVVFCPTICDHICNIEWGSYEQYRPVIEKYKSLRGQMELM